MKKSKHASYDKYFERNWNNIKNTCPFIPLLKTVASSVTTVLLSLDYSDTITKPYDITNTFNNYFTSITETIKKT